MHVSLRVLVLFILAAALGRASQGGDRSVSTGPSIKLSGSAFGTTYSIKIAAAGASIEPGQLQSRIDALLAEIDAQMSLWREDSELSRFNGHRGDDWFPVSASTARVVAAAVEVGQASGGAFDPTVSPLVQLWGFGPRRKPVRVPGDDDIAEARRHVGVSLIEVRRSPPAIRKQDPDVQLDLNGIAPGDAVDRVAELLDTLAPRGYMVEISGEVRTRGSKADGSAWNIGIEAPLIGQRIVQSVIELHDAALATSGDYRNFFERNGQRFCHTIDPRSGRPINHSLAAVSVIAADCMTADAWATALMVLGPEEGFRFAEANGIEALLLIREGDGFAARATSGFPSTRQLPGGEAQIPHLDGSITTLILTIAVFAIAIAGMSVGVMLSNRRLRGSCGGLNGLKDEKGNPLCGACTQPARDCDEFRMKMASESPDPPNRDAAEHR
ncbi:MAG: FAD:protein FMN transferase [Planctomycetaceae bacterium]